MRHSLAEKARARLRTIRQLEAEQSTERPSLLEFFPRVSCGLDAPDWLAPYAEVLSDACGGNLRVAVAAPPQHGKTELTLRAFLYWARYFPGLNHAYVTYNDTRTKEVAKDFRRIAQECGFAVSGNLEVIELGGGTKVKFTSIRSALTGFPITGVCVIDDPISGPIEARSPTVRSDCKAFWKSVARTRRHQGTSFIVMATRWHVDDLTGFLLKEENWRYVNLKAIAEPANDNDIDQDGRVSSDPLRRLPGESLWPARKPPEFFKEEQTDAYWWASMYQGSPRPQGGAVFGEPSYYTELPRDGYRVAYGVDLAVTAKTSADFSVSIEGWAVRSKEKDGKTRTKLYVVDAHIKQVTAPEFTLTLKAQQSRRAGPMRFYGSGTEKGTAQFIAKKVPKFRIVNASTDKFQRATRGGDGAASGWNRGDILMPLNEDAVAVLGLNTDWVERVVDQVTSFTGVNDVNDDIVDALAALWDEVASARIDLNTWVV